MGRPKIEIETDGIKAKIKIDGKEIKGVRGYEVTHNAGGIPELHLFMTATDMQISGELVPVLPEVYRPFYEEKSSKPMSDLPQGD